MLPAATPAGATPGLPEEPRADLTRTAAGLRALGVTTVGWRLGSGPPAAAILETARTGAAGRLALGSVAERVLRAAEVPVLLWRPPGLRGSA